MIFINAEYTPASIYQSIMQTPLSNKRINEHKGIDHVPYSRYPYVIQNLLLNPNNRNRSGSKESGCIFSNKGMKTTGTKNHNPKLYYIECVFK